jgi:predicted O-methyltransferase YrrM
MARADTPITAALSAYVREVSLHEPALLRRLREETACLAEADCQISPEQGQFMALLARLTGARKTLEVGVFTGYSSLSVALALPPGSRLVACDISGEYTSIARRYWKEAGVAGLIELRLGPAVESLDALLAEGQAGTFDFAFIDADKLNYANYYERALTLLRPGGLVAIDNVLWHGRLVDPDNRTPETLAMRQFNRSVGADERVWVSMVTIADGLTLAMKK